MRAPLGARIRFLRKAAHSMSSLHFRVIDGRTIFLDVRHNRYFALPSRLQVDFVKIAGRHEMGGISPACLASLGENSELRISDNGEVAIEYVAEPDDPTSDRWEERKCAQAPVGLVTMALLSILAARILLFSIPLKLIVMSLGAGRTGRRPTKKFAQPDRIAAAFRSADKVLGSYGNCLPRTLAYAWMCRRADFHPQLIIGVRVNPFSAHCWCQAGATVLNDELDAVRPYRPILIL